MYIKHTDTNTAKWLMLSIINQFIKLTGERLDALSIISFKKILFLFYFLEILLAQKPAKNVKVEKQKLYCVSL